MGSGEVGVLVWRRGERQGCDGDRGLERDIQRMLMIVMAVCLNILDWIATQQGGFEFAVREW